MTDTQKTGRIDVVGIGPGSRSCMSLECLDAIRDAEAVIGYKTYVRLVEGLLDGKAVTKTGMRREVERCRQAIEMARAGRRVALISGGDAGVYGMAGLALELLAERPDPPPVRILPGITAAHAAAALLGAPLMHDFATISLSDLMTDFALIEKRLDAAAGADFVIALYNPKSRGRDWQLGRAREILLRRKRPETPVGIVREARRDGERATITTLGEMMAHEVDMLTVIIVGNSQTRVHDGRMITPRGYASRARGEPET
ncbi:MAG: precorrin-3B C(17)-methyltransferase [Candidatus Accumulibacter sp.]|nr:precorrin-3B C(17)-methyltransferase [Accumulibacter sp.]